MKIVVQFSGGKDSLAALILTVEKFGKGVIAVFCDTGWEHPLTYEHIQYVTDRLGIRLVILKNKYDFIQLAKKKNRFPSTKARFCTEELKVKPFIDWVLGQNDNMIVIQGIRADESAARAKMNFSCAFFRNYFEPLYRDKNGRPRFYTYRKKEVLAHVEKFAVDIERPLIAWNSEEVFAFIKRQGFEPNPLYLKGFKRVGCFPCIMCTHQEIRNIIADHPETLNKLQDAEKEVGRTFFPPNYIPNHARKDGQLSTLNDVVKYVSGKNESLEIFEKQSCQSYYSLCE